jgi:hypothetical protein
MKFNLTNNISTKAGSPPALSNDKKEAAWWIISRAIIGFCFDILLLLWSIINRWIWCIACIKMLSICSLKSVRSPN